MELVCDKVRLDFGVAFDGVGILDDVFMSADVVEAKDLVEALHDFAHLAQFVFIIRCKDDLFHKLQSIGSIPFCIK